MEWKPIFAVVIVPVINIFRMRIAVLTIGWHDYPFRRILSTGKIFLQLGQRFRHVLSRKTDTEVVTRVVIQRSGEQKHTTFIYKLIAKNFNIASMQLREGNGSRLGANPHKSGWNVARKSHPAG